MKIVYIDLETTGINPQLSAIHQLSGIVTINGKEVEQFDFKLKPFDGSVITTAALELNGLTLDVINNYPEAPNAYFGLMKALSPHVNKFNKQDKYFFAGYNCAAFDMPFMRKFFERHGDNYFGSWFWSVPLDVMILAQEYLKNDRRDMPDFKLKTVAAKLGIHVDESKLHDALYDIQLTMQVYDVVAAKLHKHSVTI